MKSEISLKFRLSSTNNDKVIRCDADSDSIEHICKCQVYTDDSHKTWTISSWFTKDGYNGHGIGRSTLYEIFKYLHKKYGKPSKVEYIWNGTNEYIFNWLVEHFDAVCRCPIAVQKTQSDDDWESHIYDLNTDKVLEYFGIT
jgi:predicted GNAT family acetyltransferase